MLSHPKGVIHA